MLRDYQTELLSRAIVSRETDICVQAPTGAGKTHVMSALAHHYQSPSILFLAHRQEILRQIQQRLQLFSLDAGIIAPWSKETDHRVQVASVQTLSRRVKKHFDIIITDECHHATSPTYKRIYDSIGYAKHYGFTATPQRMDGVGLHSVYSDLILSEPPNWFIKHGYLSQYDYFAPLPGKRVSTSGLGSRGAEFKMEEAAALFSGGTVHGDIIQEWQTHAMGRRTIGFACTVSHASDIAQRFRDAGIPSDILIGAMSSAERNLMLERFKDGEISVLWTVDVVSEGFDLPECEAIILARPTLSLSVYLQQVGRVLRPKPDGKKAVIIDHAMNIAVHGFPCIARDWTLEGRKNSKKSKAPRSCRVCDSCGYVNMLTATDCSYCGHSFYKARAINERAATMARVNGGTMAPDAVAEEESFSDYIKLLHTAAKKGYNAGWAYHRAVEKNYKILPFHKGNALYAKFRKQMGY